VINLLGLYAALGCELVTINAHGYDDCPDEAELIWRKSYDAVEYDILDVA
jgi:hypothetical protein